MNRKILAGLAVVAGCAAVLSFSAIRDLALACGFATSLAWLLPVCVDVGAAVATALWLATDAPQVARDYARALALVSLLASVVANGLSHGLSAYQLAPPWWVVVIVSAVPAAVLGACVHLVVLARPAPENPPQSQTGPTIPTVVNQRPATASTTSSPRPVPPADLQDHDVDATDDAAVTAWAVERLRRGEHAGARTLHGLGVPKRRAEALAAQARQQHADEQIPRLVREAP